MRNSPDASERPPEKEKFLGASVVAQTLHKAQCWWSLSCNGKGAPVMYFRRWGDWSASKHHSIFLPFSLFRSSSTVFDGFWVLSLRFDGFAGYYIVWCQDRESESDQCDLRLRCVWCYVTVSCEEVKDRVTRQDPDPSIGTRSLAKTEATMQVVRFQHILWVFSILFFNWILGAIAQLELTYFYKI